MSQSVSKSISVIVPVYNVERYLWECLDSILTQTYRDFELILVDDGSTDASGTICDEYAARDDRIRVIHQANQGQSAARNHGVEFAHGEWIHFVDSDDLIHPQMLEFLLRAVSEERTPFSACHREESENLPDGFLKSRAYRAASETVTEEYLKTAKENEPFYWAPCALLVRADIVKKHSFMPGRIYEDNAVCFKWLIEAGKIAVIDEKLYFYRSNPASTMNRKFSLQKLDYLWALDEQLRYYHQLDYRKMLSVMLEEYVGSAIYLAGRVKTELGDRRLKRKTLRQAAQKCREYQKTAANWKEQLARINKRRFPRLYKVKKKLKLK